ncbi:SMI1/KNR4 family protein [Streptomyces sp. NPDC002520]
MVWREFINGIDARVEFSQGESSGRIDAAERALSCRIPEALRELLIETGSVTLLGIPVAWGVDDLVRENLDLRNSADFAELYMPFDPLLFFGAGGGGDLFAFVRRPERDRDIFVWDHESDGRWRVAFSLRDYLTQALHGAGSDWFRDR